MVAAHAALRASDAYVAAELGALVHSRGLIRDPRWRLAAAVQLVPAMVRHGASVKAIVAEVRAAARVATCPPALRGPLVALLEERLDQPGAVAVVDALWTPSWRGAGVRGVGAALAVDRCATVVALREQVADPLASREMRRVQQNGIVADRFVADLSRPGSEDEYEPSLPLVIALVDRITRFSECERLPAAERLAARLPPTTRPRALAHLSRVDLVVRGIAAALRRLRGIRHRGVAAGGSYLLVQAALAHGDLDSARAIAATIDPDLYRQRATLEIGRSLAARGRVMDALRTLAAVTAHPLIAERAAIRADLAFVVRRGCAVAFVDDAAVAAARAAPGWCVLEESSIPRSWRNLQLVTGLLLVGDPSEAGAVARRALHTPHEQRYLLSLFERVGPSPREAVLALHAQLPAAQLGGVISEHLASRARQLFWRQLDVPSSAPIPSVDARSLARALHDEAIARGEDAAPRRRVLIQAARTSLRGAFTDPDAWTIDAVASRLRTLLYLGGTLARDAIANALRLSSAAPPWFTMAFEALCVLDAAAGVDMLLERGVTLAEGGVDLDHLVAIAEAHRGFVRGFALAWVRARRHLGLALGETAGLRWLLGLFAAYDAARPTPALLEWLAERREIPATPGAVVEEIRLALAALAAEPVPARVAARVAADRPLLERLLVTRPANVHHRFAPWSLDQWARLVSRAASGATLAPQVVERFACGLGRGSARNALEVGNLTALGAPSTTELVVSDQAYVVRLLDKRADMLTYLRFADVSRHSCFRSDTSWYRDAWHDTQGRVLEVWRDPLSFCFRVEAGPARRPAGFVFGGFAWLGDTLAIVLNGLYLRPQTNMLRFAVLEAIERALCGSLGIRHVGLANEHGGWGAVPAGYERHPVSLTRLRALAGRSGLVTDAYDDISNVVNRPVHVPHLWWKHLPGAGAADRL